jgi:hypothetical protein
MNTNKMLRVESIKESHESENRKIYIIFVEKNIDEKAHFIEDEKTENRMPQSTILHFNNNIMIIIIIIIILFWCKR